MRTCLSISLNAAPNLYEFVFLGCFSEVYFLFYILINPIYMPTYLTKGES